MRAVVQRVSRAQVSIAAEVVGRIDRGLLVLLGIHKDDTAAEIPWLAEKVASLRIFNDADGKMNVGLREAGGAVLVVSQFTLYGDVQKGRRPSFIDAAVPAVAEPLYEQFVNALRALGVPVETGRFGGDMQVELVNDGPVTLVIGAP